MAKPAGCRVVCRPNRKSPRKFTADDCGRVVCLAREAGESAEDIEKAISKCLPEREGACDCERLNGGIQIAIAAAAGVAAIILRNQRAAAIAREAIKKAQESAKRGKIDVEGKDAVGIELAKREMDRVAKDSEIAHRSVTEMLDRLKILKDDAFSLPPNAVTIGRKLE